MTSAGSPLFNPFPGLRPFRDSEAHLFFGRSGQVDELLARLRTNRFVAVMGASGSGKSSLVRAGLLPALHGGFSPRVGSHWRIAVFRPGANPMHNLAAALARPGVLGTDAADPVVATAAMEAALRRSGMGLADTARREVRDGRLLVVVDQFEELFRFHAVGGASAPRPGDAAAFVRLLVEAAAADAPVDVVITMRSDFLGDCSQFRDLPDAVNDGLFLVPRLTRAQLRDAITGPAAVGGGAIAPRLVQRLLNDAGADPDLLPVLQHALMRTWDIWSAAARGPMDLEHYEAGGGLDEALARHADEAFDELPDDRARGIAEAMLKRLTDVDVDGREVRRPSPLDEIAAVAGATPDEVRGVIAHFARPGRSFVNVSGDDVVDISHESLIRQWPRLRAWVHEEAESRDLYRRLADAARRWDRGEAALLRNPELQLTANWWTRARPNQAWAERYDAAFEQAAGYLIRSRAAARRRRLSLAAGVAALAVLAVVATVLALVAQAQRDRAERQERLAVARQLAALSEAQGPQQRPRSILTALEAVRATGPDGIVVAAAEEALRTALQAPIGIRLPGAVGQDGHVGPVRAVTFGLAGSLVATAGDDGAVLLWDVDDPAADPLRLLGHERAVVALAASPDGRVLASGSDDGTARLWRTADPAAPPLVLKGHDSSVAVVAFSPDGGRLVTGGADGRVLLWEAAEPLAGPVPLGEHDGFVRAAAFNPDGGLVVSGGGDQLAFVWRAGDPQAPPERLAGHEAAVTSAAFAPDGGSLATGSEDGTVRVWELDGSPAAQAVLAHRDAVTALAFSPDGGWLATGSADRTARLWALGDAAPIGDSIVVPHDAAVAALAFSPAGDWLATGSRDNTVRLLATADPAGEPAVLGGHEAQVTALDFSRDERWLATGGGDGAVWLWDLDGLTTRPAVLRHDARPGAARADVVDLAFDPQRGRLATAGTDKVVRLWEPDRPQGPVAAQELDQVEAYRLAFVTALAFGPDGDVLATGSGDRTIRLLDPDDLGAAPRSLPPLDGTVLALDISPDGTWLAAAVQDGPALVWELADLAGGPAPLGGHDDITDLAFSPDGGRLAAAGRDGRLLVYTPADPSEPLAELDAHGDHVTTVAYAPTGGLLASGDVDGTVVLWDAGDGRPTEVRRLAHDERVVDVAFHPDGSQLAVAYEQPAVLLWDLSGDAAAEPVVLDGHEDRAAAVAFSPDGELLATGAMDETARLWPRLDELIRLGCAAAGRNLTQDEWDALLPGEDYRQTCDQWPAGP